ncbi:MAG: DNA mismatch repair endonuclease MutL, partial [Hymenobacteraceae bacterium]|nr:DNA mismatch repair endonuclease MutL [Hymenobacteraceae bacterium]
MDLIRLLPEHLANQIAAGEVVQRPASVVKELLENALDAGAKSLKLIVRDAGRTLIQVIDDGGGMSETDARLSLERHATSKIRETDDLFKLRTFGFRGEALASIAAVARVELKTCLPGAETGTRLLIENSRVIEQEPCATPPGTSIAVRDLFYNVPARRAFLKSNAVEMRHILDEFQRVALAHPDVSFSLFQHELEVFQLPPVKLSQRIVALLGAGYKSHLAACDQDTASVRVRGFIGKPEGARKARGDQFFFVNGRFIRSAYLNHAVLTAYEGLLARETHPFYALFLDLDPAEIDINVHPTKTEIKFADERTVYAIVCAAVRQALGLYNLAPSLDFEGDVNFTTFGGGSQASAAGGAAGAPPAARPPATVPTAPDTSPARRNPPMPASTFDGPTALGRSLPRPSAADDLPDDAVTRAAMAALAARFGAGAPAAAPPPRPPAPVAGQVTVPLTEHPESSSFKVFQLHQQYLVVPVRSGLMLIDQRAARERILFDDYTRVAERAAPAAAQALLFPQALHFSAADFALVQELLPELEALGFRLRLLGPRALAAEGLPADLPAAAVQGPLGGGLGQGRAGRAGG